MSSLERWLILHLEGPLVAFGGATIDHVGVTREFPAASMLTGMIANALGWDRAEWGKHQALQDRLVFAARIDRESLTGVLTDMQNVQHGGSDEGWTTTGSPERRGGGEKKAPRQRKRDYLPDAAATVALRLISTDRDLELDLDRIAAALVQPSRPIFLGRKPCLPSALIIQPGEETVSAPTAYDALSLIPTIDGIERSLRCCWPVGEGPKSGDSVFRIVEPADLRNWRSGLHGGWRQVVEGTVHCLGARK